MATGTFLVDEIVSQDQVSATTANLAAQDGNWALAASTSASVSLRVGFANIPAGNELTGTQAVDVQLRKNNGAGANNPSYVLDVYEGDTLISSGTLSPLSSATGVVASTTFNASLLTDKTGANVRLHLTISAAGGSPSKRCSADVGYVALRAAYDAAVVAGSSFVIVNTF